MLQFFLQICRCEKREVQLIASRMCLNDYASSIGFAILEKLVIY